MTERSFRGAPAQYLLCLPQPTLLNPGTPCLDSEERLKELRGLADRKAMQVNLGTDGRVVTKKEKLSQGWWCRLIIPFIWETGEEDGKFKASPGFKVSSRPAWAT